MMCKQTILLIFVCFIVNGHLASCNLTDLLQLMKNSTRVPFPAPYSTDVNTTQYKSIKAPPLIFANNPIQLSRVYNTGSSLFFSTTQSYKTSATGGIFGNETYYFFQAEYFWDLDLKNDVGNKLNGFGSPVQGVLSYYNSKYSNEEEASTKPDGIVQFILFVEVTYEPNYLFYPFQFMVQSIKEAKTSVLFLEYFAYNWFFYQSSTNDYYVYPGVYVDPKTKKMRVGSKVALLIRTPIPHISIEQFMATFGALRNNKGKPYSNKLQRIAMRPISLERYNGIFLILK